MIISVIIPTRNRASLLEKFLLSLKNQTLAISSYEVVIIDNGSTDYTKSLVEKYIPIIPNLKYIFEPNPGLHSGRHRGFLESQGEILVYGDDDIEVFPQWLETIYHSFQENPDVAMIGGKNLPQFESNPPSWLEKMWQPNQSGEQILGYLSILNLGDEVKFVSPYYIFGCNFAIRRSILETARGFHPDGMPQELIKYRGDGESYVSSYVQQKGYKALYHPDASVYHWVSNKRMTLEYFCLRAYNQGISDSYTKIRAGLEQEQNVSNKYSSVSLIHKLKGSYQKILNLARKVKKKISSLNDVDVELRDIKQNIASAYQDGFNFHQEQIEKDPLLLEWVLRPDYWDYQLPHYDKE
ncbi:MAG: glycosyltransferase family 2 protein [Dolichospermum sp.]